MLDIKFLLDNIDQFEGYFKQRNLDKQNQHRITNLYQDHKQQQQKLESLLQRRNSLSQFIGEKKAQKLDAAQQIKEVGVVKEEIDFCKEQTRTLSEKLEEILLNLPNILDASVPIGESEADNVEIKKNTPSLNFDFQVKSHLEVGQELGLMPQMASKVSGSRFCFFADNMALLHRALAQFMLYENRQAGYTEIYVPYIVNQDSLIGTGQLPKFAEDLFQIDEQKYLIPTAEVPLTNMMRDTIVDSLPIRYTSHSPCFRSEAGSYGKDTQGIIRQHQFDKVELVEFCQPQDSEQRLEVMVEHVASLLDKLKLSYRIMLLCSADTGFSSSKTYDLEVWMPSHDAYREISSCSNCKDFQARRMNARYKDDQKKTRFIHTLNGSALAVGRTLAAILENYQRADGSVEIPEVLHLYTDGITQLKN